MSEEEIIKNIEKDIFRFNDLIYFFETDNLYEWINIDEVREKLKTYQGILDLYQKEKQKNNELLYKLQQKIVIETHEQIQKDFISKDKIRKKIKKLEKREKEIYKLDYTLEPEKAIDCVILRISDLNELLEED